MSDQVTELLRRGVVEGRWRGTLPGRNRLAEELGCSHRTAEEAMRRLVKEGLLVSPGAGRQRRIQLLDKHSPQRPMSILILGYDKTDLKTSYLTDLIHRLGASGHQVSFASRTIRQLRMDTEQLARLVKKSDADAWIVVAGTQSFLQWFAEQPTPTFALFGRMRQVPLASTSPSKLEAIAELVGRLAAMGHRRIVNIVSEERRKPTLGFPEQFYLEELRKHGITTGPYNVPDWEDSPEGLQRLLDSLFRHTPPTAMLIDQPVHFVAARDHLASRGILSPRDVSLACLDADMAFEWCRPAITHISWDTRLMVNAVVKWANNISRGKDDRRKSMTKAQLVIGGTIGAI